MKKIVEVSGLIKSYQNKRIINNIDFSINQGEFVALLGPNGSGKSTIISILCGLLQFDSGDIRICGYRENENNMELRQHIGVVFQNSVLDDILSLRNNLLLRCGFYNLKKKQAYSRIEELISLCDLKDFIDQKVSTLSGGQRRKGDIARALIANPRLLILDEPTTGLDPQSRLQIWQTIESLQRDNTMAILLTTHYLEEAEKASQIIMIKHGKMIAQGTVATLTKQFVSGTLRIYSNDLEMLQHVLKKNNIAYVTKENSVEIALSMKDNPLSILKKIEMYVRNFEVHLGTLEEAYFKIMKEEL